MPRRNVAVKRIEPVLLVVATLLVVVGARAGHEFPVYPSYYPHAVTVETIDPDPAAQQLRSGTIQAYVGGEPAFGAKAPESVTAVESLGSLLVIRVNRASPLAQDAASACTVARTIVRAIATHPARVTIHPYPVTPLHGDFLYHADLAAAARRDLLEGSAATLPATARLRVRALGTLARSALPERWITDSPSADATVEDLDAEHLMTAAATQTNGWMGPPWVRTGWFNAVRLLGGSIDDATALARVTADRRRLGRREYASVVERINLERDLVTALTSGCRALVAGYSVKRAYLNTDYSAGIENIGYDFVTGLASSIFVRTVKLKDFPWNGRLAIGIDSNPTAAWNPIAGFDDPFGRLLWSALGDPALLPAPDDVGWMLNRVSDVRSSAAGR